MRSNARSPLSLPLILHLREKPINSKSYFRSYHDVDDDEKRGCEPKEQPSGQESRRTAAAGRPLSLSLSLRLSCS